MKKKESKPHLLLALFATFFKISCFSFGGGYAMIPVMQREVVEKNGWMKDEDFVDMLAVTQSAPGPIAVNTAVFTGYNLAGYPGAITALCGSAFPSFFIMLLLALLLTLQGGSDTLDKFFRGLRPAVVALILSAGLGMGKQSMKSVFNILIGVAVFILLIVVGIHPVILLVGGAALGIIRWVLFNREKRAGDQ